MANFGQAMADVVQDMIIHKQGRLPNRVQHLQALHAEVVNMQPLPAAFQQQVLASLQQVQQQMQQMEGRLAGRIENSWKRTVNFNVGGTNQIRWLENANGNVPGAGILPANAQLPATRDDLATATGGTINALLNFYGLQQPAAGPASTRLHRKRRVLMDFLGMVDV